MYNAYIKQLEKGNISAAEEKCITDALLVKADNRKLVNSELCKKGCFVELEDAGDTSSYQFDFYVSDCYGTADENITEWINPFNNLKCMPCVTLSESHTWEDMHKSLELMICEKIILSESADTNGP
jgi:hypothetical protein